MGAVGLRARGERQRRALRGQLRVLDLQRLDEVEVQRVPQAGRPRWPFLLRPGREDVVALLLSRRPQEADAVLFVVFFQNQKREKNKKNKLEFRARRASV